MSKPNFCESCGGEVNGKAPAKRRSKSVAKSDLSDNETDIDYVPELDGIEVDTEVYGGSFTIGSLAGENTPPKFKQKNTYTLDEFKG